MLRQSGRDEKSLQDVDGPLASRLRGTAIPQVENQTGGDEQQAAAANFDDKHLWIR